MRLLIVNAVPLIFFVWIMYRTYSNAIAKADKLNNIIQNLVQIKSSEKKV